MKSSSQILGLPVLSIQDGKIIGKVKHLVLSPQQRTVEYLLVEDEAWFMGFKLLPFKAAQGIGEYALTVSDRSSLTTVTECPAAVALLERDLQLPGLKVLTKKGRIAGTVNEFYLNENSGEISGCQLIGAGDDNPAGIIASSLILTYGQDYLIVEEAIESHLVNELQEEEPQTTEIIIRMEDNDTNSVVQATSVEKDTVDTLKHFEDQQKKFLIGKKLAVSIFAANGEVVAKEGEIITDAVVERAKANDRFVQLTMNVRE